MDNIAGISWLTLVRPPHDNEFYSTNLYGILELRGHAVTTTEDDSPYKLLPLKFLKNSWKVSIPTKYDLSTVLTGMQVLILR